MPGQHGRDGEKQDELPGVPYQPPKPTTDGSAPPGDGQHRGDDEDEKK